MTETRLICVSNPDSNQGVAVIFVHGLGGDPFGTWSSSSDESSFWPGWLADDLSGLAVYTLAYDAAVSSWIGSGLPIADRAANVFECLAVETSLKTKQIILVCHSLGGLIAKAVLRYAEDRREQREEAKYIVDQVRAVVFLATPHVGSRHASFADLLRTIVRPSAATLDMKYDDAELRDLNNWYRRWTENENIYHLVFKETRPTSIGAIVDHSSADPGIYRTDAIPIDLDHIGIAKPKNRESLLYRIIVDFINSRFDQLVKRERSNRFLKSLVKLPLIISSKSKISLLDRSVNFLRRRPIFSYFTVLLVCLIFTFAAYRVWYSQLSCQQKWLSSNEYQACFDKIVSSMSLYPIQLTGKIDSLGNEVYKADWRNYPVDASNFCWLSCSGLSSARLAEVNKKAAQNGYNPVSITVFRDLKGRDRFQVTWQKTVGADQDCGGELRCVPQ